MDHCVEKIDDESDDDREQHVQGHVPFLAVAVATGSRRRLGHDHALRKEYQCNKQAEESNQEEDHEDGHKHFGTPGAHTDFVLN